MSFIATALKTSLLWADGEMYGTFSLKQNRTYRLHEIFNEKV